ncbi:hypothetical protein WS50_20565 [Burkholderia territorii]|nr:hypothetical protein WS47_22485 [Burkholderia territorii]KUZ09481.1 hypothetical protein WS50_20565 [Burkholderia territorii]
MLPFSHQFTGLKRGRPGLRDTPILVMIGLRAPRHAHGIASTDMHGTPVRSNRQGDRPMWYFSWILGIGVALGFGIINAMWLEAEVFSRGDKRAATSRTDPGSRHS